MSDILEAGETTASESEAGTVQTLTELTVQQTLLQHMPLQGAGGQVQVDVNQRNGRLSSFKT